MNNPCEKYVWEQPKRDIMEMSKRVDGVAMGAVSLSAYYNTWADVATAPLAGAMYTTLTPAITEIIYNLNHASNAT